MKTSIEITYYPLHDRFIPHIKAFIERLKSYDSIVVKPNTMSTQVFGDYDNLTSIVNAEIKKSFDKIPHSIFIMKIINADLQAND
jgi:uncharacterized protein YqgV (UPF0045/DUF77 family)